VPNFSIESVKTHAEPNEKDELVQWCEITVLIPKGFDFTKGSAKLLKQLEFAVGLIGRTDS